MKVKINNSLSQKEFDLQNIPSFNKGDKVTINYKQIIERSKIQNYTAKFLEWILNNKDKVFTIEYDKTQGINNHLVCLKEDSTNPKWLIWALDLIRDN